MEEHPSFQGITEDFELCDPFYWRRYQEGDIPPPNYEHASRLVGVGKEYHWIDIPLAEVIYYAWKLGIPTHESCEDYLGNGLNAFISFPDFETVEWFLDLSLSHLKGGTWDFELPHWHVDAGQTIELDFEGFLSWNVCLNVDLTPEYLPLGDSWSFFERPCLSFRQAALPLMAAGLKKAFTESTDGELEMHEEDDMIYEEYEELLKVGEKPWKWWAFLEDD